MTWVENGLLLLILKINFKKISMTLFLSGNDNLRKMGDIKSNQLSTLVAGLSE
jgi:hypothetical protein